MAKSKNNNIVNGDAGVQGQYKNWFLDYASYVII
jgi:topoisomerase-4 subunit A